MSPTVAALEAAFLTAWPAVRHVHDGAWIWREAGGFTKRANSAQSHDDADDADAPARLARCAALSRYAAEGERMGTMRGLIFDDDTYFGQPAE